MYRFTITASSSITPRNALNQFGIPARVHDAQAGHAEDEGTDRDADGVAVAAGHQGATDHRGDDVEELVAHTVAGLEHVEVVQVVHAGEPAEEPDGHEQADLDPGDRHTDRAGRRGVSADGVDPVADLGPGEDPLRQHDEERSTRAR